MQDRIMVPELERSAIPKRISWVISLALVAGVVSLLLNFGSIRATERNSAREHQCILELIVDIINKPPEERRAIVNPCPIEKVDP